MVYIYLEKKSHIGICSNFRFSTYESNTETHLCTFIDKFKTSKKLKLETQTANGQNVLHMGKGKADYQQVADIR